MKFRATLTRFSGDDLNIRVVPRKEVCSYEEVDSWMKLNESTLLEKKDFYSSLTELDISNEDYQHALTT